METKRNPNGSELKDRTNLDKTLHDSYKLKLSMLLMNRNLEKQCSTCVIRLKVRIQKFDYARTFLVALKKNIFSPVEKGEVWHLYRTKILKNEYNSWTFAPCLKSKKKIHKLHFITSSLTCYKV